MIFWQTWNEVLRQSDNPGVPACGAFPDNGCPAPELHATITHRKGTHETMRKNTNQRKLLPVMAVLVATVAVTVTLMPKNAADGAPPVFSDQADSDLLLSREEIGSEASYFDYDVDGTTVQVLAVLASDGTIRLALNTCQVCSGSPYAYFVQDGDWFICQNCKNRFASTEVGIISGGCNPVPITEDVYSEQDGIITIPSDFLEDSAALFRNWKQF